MNKNSLNLILVAMLVVLGGCSTITNKLIPTANKGGYTINVIKSKPKITGSVLNIPGNQLVEKYFRPPQVSLLVILKSQIEEQVRANMGKGNSKNILNYRTGRFASSVAIERVSESRAGLISVFYNYQKNPYATFSEGGRQQYPKSRDPKLLISKSIREIASSVVSNRLRAVLV